MNLMCLYISIKTSFKMKSPDSDLVFGSFKSSDRPPSTSILVDVSVKIVYKT